MMTIPRKSWAPWFAAHGEKRRLKEAWAGITFVPVSEPERFTGDKVRFLTHVANELNKETARRWEVHRDPASSRALPWLIAAVILAVIAITIWKASS